jgi:hypothetical protein
VRGLVSPLVFLALIACFLLPFLTVTSVGRRASASGLDLVTANASFSGTYTHAAYEGEVESVVANARIPAIVVLGAALVGAAATGFPGRNPLRVGFTSAIVAVLAYLALLQVTWPRFSPPDADHLPGFWLAGALLSAALAWHALRLWREPRDAATAARSPDRAPSRLR